MKRIDEMMKYYEWTADAEKSRPLSPEEQARILAKTLDKAGLSKGVPTYEKMATAKPKGKEKGKEKMSRKKFLTIGVAAALCLSVAGVSAASLGLSDKFMEFLNPVDDKQAEVVGSAGTVIDQKVTENGMTIHVKEAMGDSNSVYVLSLIHICWPDIRNIHWVTIGASVPILQIAVPVYIVIILRHASTTFLKY